MPFVDTSLLTRLDAHSKIIEFANYINIVADVAPFPDYLAMDLMNVASLVSNIYVVKVEPKDDKRLLIHFSGTNIDDLYERNVTGHYLEDIYTGDNREAVMDNMNALIDQKQSYYFVDTAEYKQASYQKRRIMKRIACPCSSDGETINYLVGLVIFDIYSQGDTNILAKV